MKTKKKDSLRESTNFLGFGQSDVFILLGNFVIVMLDIMVTGCDKGLKNGTYGKPSYTNHYKFFFVIYFPSKPINNIEHYFTPLTPRCEAVVLELL